MKHRFYSAISLVVLLLVTTECNDKALDLNDPNTITEEVFYKTEADAIKASNAMYASLQKLGTYSSHLPLIYDARGLDFKMSAGSTYIGLIGIDNFQPLANAGGLNESWQMLYEGVFRTNVVLEKVPAISMDATRKEQLMGEAHFLRGFYYYHLAMLYGNVPIVLTTPKSENDYFVATSPAAQVYDQVISDFTEAKRKLPLKSGWPSTELGRATKGAAQGFLGKMYLYLGRYAEARTELGEVISSNEYDLVPDYYSNFTEENENNAESVFEVQFKNTPGDQWGGQTRDQVNVCEGNLIGTFYGASAGGGAASMVQPTLDLMNAFEPGDPRKDATAYYIGGVDFNPAGTPKKWTDPVNFAGRKYFKNAPDPNFFCSGINVRVMRYSDVLLMYAEALNELGATTEALTYINRVRERVKMPNYPTAGYPATTQGDVFRIIMHERFVEFGGEQQNWNDLVRWDNNGKIDMTPYFHNPIDPGNRKMLFDKTKHKFLPIPQRETDVNPNAVQNEGYQ